MLRITSHISRSAAGEQVGVDLAVRATADAGRQALRLTPGPRSQRERDHADDVGALARRPDEALHPEIGPERTRSREPCAGQLIAREGSRTTQAQRSPTRPLGGTHLTRKPQRVPPILKLRRQPPNLWVATPSSGVSTHNVGRQPLNEARSVRRHLRASVREAMRSTSRPPVGTWRVRFQHARWRPAPRAGRPKGRSASCGGSGGCG